MKKLIWIILFAAAGYFAYVSLFAPTKVTLSSYKEIQQGMSLSQVESKLATGLIRALFRGIETDQDKGEEILNEFAKDSRGGIQDMLRQRAPAGTIKGTSASKGGISHFDQDGLLAANTKDEYVSKEGTWKSDKTFVPAKRTKIRNSTTRGAGGIQNVSSYGEYEFHEYIEDMTVNNRPYKLIRTGIIHFDPKPDGRFETWKGKDERIITVLLTGEKVSYWSYQGPAEDFPKTSSQPTEQPKVSPPDSEVKKIPAPAAPVQKIPLKDELPAVKAAVSKEAPEAPEPVKEIEQRKPEVTPQPQLKDESMLKIKGYQKKIEEAKASLEAVRAQYAQAKSNYDNAVNSQANASDMDKKKKAYVALNAQMEKLYSDIQTYNRFISKLKADGITEPISSQEGTPATR